MESVLDWDVWVRRFDRMQERYLNRRAERFVVIVGVIRAIQESPARIIDLGCGTGTLTQAILEAFPSCRVRGVDLDESLLALAKARLRGFGDRVELVCQDLRDAAWFGRSRVRFCAAVSATALHWLSPENLAKLYRSLASIVKPGGVFLNADHAASGNAQIQAQWKRRRDAAVQSFPDRNADTWSGFFKAYAEAIGADPGTIGENAVGPWEGVEEGMPLAWHFDRLREAGFVEPDCFWRCDCDAVYGALRSGKLTT
jgi:SAM-dependent methyltransferase